MNRPSLALALELVLLPHERRRPRDPEREAKVASAFVRVVAEAFGLSTDDLRDPRRLGTRAERARARLARSLVAYRLRHYERLPWAAIAEALSLRHLPTVYQLVRRAEGRLADYVRVAELLAHAAEGA